MLSKLRRLLMLTPDEVRVRATQAVSRSLERFAAYDRHVPGPAELDRLIADASGRSLDWWYGEFCEQAPARFFRSFDDLPRTAACIRAHMPDAVEVIVDRATRMLEGRYDLLGVRDVAVGQKVAWHRDPINGVSAPRSHWSTIDYLDPRVAGDHKAVWELNRHHVLVTLVQASLYSDRPEFTTRAVTLIHDWIAENRPKLGVNWASSLEIALRAIAWIWTTHLLRGTTGVSRELFAHLSAQLHVAGRHVERYLSTYFSPNTHLTGEALGLFYIGTQLPWLPEASRWRDLGWKILLDRLPQHVRADGTYFEQSTHYQRYTLEFYSHLMLLADRVGLPGRERIGPSLERMTDALLALRRPDGSMPLIGDDDGGRLLFLDGRDSTDLSAPLSTGAVLFGRGDFAAVAGEPSCETVWLLGPDAVESFQKLPRREPPFRSRALGDAGWFVMRDGWERDANMLFIDGGPHGALSHGHAHADALSIDMSIRGQAIFIDPGTFTYTWDARLRDAFRSTRAHNTVTIDGVDSSAMRGPFTWDRAAETRVHTWAVTDLVDCFVGSHDGYRRLAPPATHTRTVLFVKSDYWFIQDAVTSTGPHRVTATFQCAPGLEVEAGDGRELQLRARNGVVARLLAFGPDLLMSHEPGWVSPGYAHRLPAATCRVELPVQGSAVLPMVLLAGSAPVDVSESRDGITLRGQRWTDTIVLDPSRADARDVETDAALVWIRRDPGTGAILALVALDATFVVVDGVGRLTGPGGPQTLWMRSAVDGWRIGEGQSLTASSSSFRSAPGVGAPTAGGR